MSVCVRTGCLCVRVGLPVGGWPRVGVIVDMFQEVNRKQSLTFKGPLIFHNTSLIYKGICMPLLIVCSMI